MPNKTEHAKRTIDADSVREKIKSWIDQMDGSDLERFLAQEFYCGEVEYLPETDEIAYVSTDPTEHDPFYSDENWDMPQNSCPACKSDNIANEGPTNDDGELEVTCHNCSFRWNEPNTF